MTSALILLTTHGGAISFSASRHGESVQRDKENLPEPWLRGTHTDLPAVARGVLHAFELAREDVHLWCGRLSDGQIQMQVLGLPSLAFQLRHMAGSLDRLLTYAEGGELTEEQVAGGQSQRPSREWFARGAARGNGQEFGEQRRAHSEFGWRGFGSGAICGKAEATEQPRRIAGACGGTHAAGTFGQLVTTAKVLHELHASGGISPP